LEGLPATLPPPAAGFLPLPFSDFARGFLHKQAAAKDLEKRAGIVDGREARQHSVMDLYPHCVYD
jgi:hypothetical protein